MTQCKSPVCTLEIFRLIAVFRDMPTVPLPAEAAAKAKQRGVLLKNVHASRGMLLAHEFIAPQIKVFCQHVNRSPARRDSLKKIQEALADVPQHSLITSAGVRWGNSQRINERFLEQREARWLSPLPMCSQKW
jgi:hypothetical protein